MGNNVTLIPKQPARHSLLTNVENVVYMPLASRHSHGIVKIGDGLNISQDGLVSVDFSNDWFGNVSTQLLTLNNDVAYLKDASKNISDRVNVVTIDITNIKNELNNIPNIYQTKDDDKLNTVDKSVVGGINEIKIHTQSNASDIKTIEDDVTGIKKNYATITYVESLYSTVSMGGHKSVMFDTRKDFIDWLDGVFIRTDGLTPSLLNVGDMILIVEMNVPDYWVKSKSENMSIENFSEYEAKIDIPEVKIDNVSISKNDKGEFQAISLKNAFKNIENNISYSDFTGMIRLTRDQYRNLVEYGSIIVDGETIVYDDGTLYAVSEVESDDLQLQINELNSSIEMKADRAVVDQNTVEIVNLQSTVTELTPKVMRALVTPMSAPTTTELVGVDDGNSQTMIEIGDGVVLDNGVLKSKYWEELIYSGNELFKTNTTYNFNKTVGSYETIELELRSGGHNSSYFVKMKTIPSGGSSYIYIPEHNDSELNQISISFTDTSMIVGNSLIPLSDYDNWVLQKIRWIHR